MTVSFTRNYWPDPVWSLNSGVELAVDPSGLPLTSLERCQGFDDFIRTTAVPAVNCFSVTKSDSNFNCHSSNPGHIPRSLSCRAVFISALGYSSTIKIVLPHVLQARATLAVRKLAISKARLNLLKRRPLGFLFTLEKERGRVQDCVE